MAIGFPVRLESAGQGAGGPGDDGGGENTLTSIQGKINSLSPVFTIGFITADTAIPHNQLLISIDGGTYTPVIFTGGSSPVYTVRIGMGYKFAHTPVWPIAGDVGAVGIIAVFNCFQAVPISPLSTWHTAANLITAPGGTTASIQNFYNLEPGIVLFQPTLNTILITPQTYSQSATATSGQMTVPTVPGNPTSAGSVLFTLSNSGMQSMSNCIYNTNMILIR